MRRDNICLYLGAAAKGLPKAVASSLGGAILPGIAALDGDGVSKPTVRDLIISADRTAQALLDECDMVHSILAAGNGPGNIAVLRRRALDVLRRDTSKSSLSIKSNVQAGTPPSYAAFSVTWQQYEPNAIALCAQFQAFSRPQTQLRAENACLPGRNRRF